MRDYAKVSPHFWVGKTGKQLKKDPNGLMVALYLMTNPHANMLGLYYIPVMYIAHETGLNFEGASKGLQSACEAGFCTYDHETEVVWVYEMARFQVADELKPADNRCKGVQKDYDSLPENPFLSAFYDKYSIPFCMAERRGDNSNNTSPLEAPCKPLRSQEQEQEQEQEQFNSSSSAHEQKNPPPPIQFSQYQSEDHKRYTLLGCVSQYPIQNDFIELAQARFENIPTQDLITMFSGGGMFCDFFSARGNQSENTASLWLVKWFTWIENNKDQVKRNREKQNQAVKQQQSSQQEPSYFERIFAEQRAASEIKVGSVEIPVLGVSGNA